MPENTPDISVIIPCYNEQKNLENHVLNEVVEYLDTKNFSWEVLIVNDGSSDNSLELVHAFAKDHSGFSVLDIEHGGKPTAVWAGIQAAKGDIVLFTDMDQSTPIVEFDKLLPYYEQDYEFVIGSRGVEREGTAAIRQLGSVVFLGLRQLVLLRDIRDTQCGFKSCKRYVATELFPKLQFFQTTERPEGWKVSAYDVELLFMAEKAGYKLKEVEVRWLNRDQSDTKSPEGTLKRYVRESLDMAKEVMRVKRNERNGIYDALMKAD